MDPSIPHQCLLPHEDIISSVIDTGIFIDTRRKIRKYFMVNRKHPCTGFYIKSMSQIRNEELQNLLRYYYMIHPFSMFSLHWTYVMTIVFCTSFYTIPLYLGLALQDIGLIRWTLFVCQVFHGAHVIICFFTGYHNTKKNTVVMDPLKVAKSYVLSYFFPDVISIVPVIITDLRYYDVDSMFVYSLSQLYILKLVRIFTLFRYLHIIRQKFGFSNHLISIIELVMIIIGILLWVDVFKTYFISENWSRSYLVYVTDIERITLTLSKSGFTWEDYSTVVAILTVILSFLLHLILLVYVSHLWKKFNSVATNHRSFHTELDAYLIYKGLPMKKRGRIKMFFDFKFHGNYYKESTLQNIMSDNLKYEVMLAVAESSIKKVDLFKGLSDDVLQKFSKYLTSEIYLPEDVIIKSGTMGDAIYFILAGTVAIISTDGRTISYLRDGTSFGEMALILRIPRVASVVAVTPCEIFRLRREHFLRAFNRNHSVLDALREVAHIRLANLTSMSSGGLTSSKSISRPLDVVSMSKGSGINVLKNLSPMDLLKISKSQITMVSEETVEPASPKSEHTVLTFMDTTVLEPDKDHPYYRTKSKQDSLNK